MSAPDAFGPVTITLQPSAASNIPGFTLTGYIIDDDKIQLVTSQQDDVAADLGGTALSQGDSAGAFDDSDLADTKYVHASMGADNDGSLVTAGAFAFNPDGSLAGTLAVNNIGTHASTPVTAGTWVLEPTGSVACSGSGEGRRWSYRRFY